MPASNNKETRTRRTIKACVICHKKKVRCDIDDVEGDVCTPCRRDGYECVPRERKRKRFTLSPSPPAGQRQSKQRNDSIDEEHQSMESGIEKEDGNVVGVSTSAGQKELEDTTDPSLHSTNHSSTAASLQESSLLERIPNPDYLKPPEIEPRTRSDSNYKASRSVSYLGRLEYLRGEVPVNDDAGLPDKVPRRLSDTDIEILRVQRVMDLPPRAIRESLMDAFWTRCYPWSPVVERSWVEQSPGKISLLLQHAMLLAGSRVSAPLPNYPSEEFYKKARVLFWMGAEEDPIITLAASCLLHWWNPQGPETISLDTSSFWLRVCTGLAYQIGLHREPNGKVDAGLRRRIWWSLVVRDSLINAGHGRPRAIDLKLADVSPISDLDFDGATASAELFSSYVGISCILGDLTQSYLRKHGLQEHKRPLEDRLFRWLKTLPDHLQLCRATEGRPLKPYNFEARQLHVQYFTVLIILHRQTDPVPAPSAASLLASSYIAGIFEDFMARDELRYLGPIFTFYCLTAGMAQLDCYRYSGMVHLAEENLTIMARALEDLNKRWPTAVGSLKHLMDSREKLVQRPHQGQFPVFNFPSSAAQFFSDFGPELCRMWHPINQRLPGNQPVASSELEMAGILQGLRTPNDVEAVKNTTLTQPIMATQASSGVPLEPTLLQPQEWFGPYEFGNWLMSDWDQGLRW